MNKVYEIVTDRIVKSLESGVVPWRTPWHTSAPKNLNSKKAYRGVNVFLLGAMRYTTPWWLTYKQATAMGGQVRKGEHGAPVVFWKVYDNKPGEQYTADGKRKPKRFVLRYYTVFNVSQCDGIEAPVENEVRPFTPLEAAERIVTKYIGKGPRVEHGGDRAAYMPGADVIHMPPREAFHSPEAYYSTRFHEMVHSTGHPDRLNRDGIAKFDGFATHNYSFEELVAECGAAFLCGEAGILDTTFDNSAAYINHWVAKLKSEPKWIVQAGGKASAAADYILGRKADGSEEDADVPEGGSEEES